MSACRRTSAISGRRRCRFRCVDRMEKLCSEVAAERRVAACNDALPVVTGFNEWHQVKGSSLYTHALFRHFGMGAGQRRGTADSIQTALRGLHGAVRCSLCPDRYPV